MDWPTIGAWAADFGTRHKESLGLFALALAVTMPSELPWPFNKVPILAWSHLWLKNALQTFVSIRGPSQHTESIQNTQKKEIITEPSGKKTESISTQTTADAEHTQEPKP